MPTPMIPQNWPLLLEPGLRSIFFLQSQALVAESVRSQLFSLISSTKSQEHFYGVGGMSDVPEFNGTIEYDSFDGLYETNFSHKEYAKGMAAERKLVDDDQYNVINQRASMLALTFERTREKFAAGQFNNAFTSGFNGADGQPLVSASHPLSPLNATTISNLGAAVLSPDAIRDARIAMRKFQDDKGELITVRPDTLLVPPDLEETATVIVETANKVDSSDNNINYIRTKIKNVIVWDYLTDTNAWFLIDSAMAKLHNFWIQRVNLEFALDPASDFNLIAKYRGYERYSFGWDDWRWIYGSNPS